MLFAWLKMAEICSSPFDGDAFYDINLVDELEVIIWGSSVALEPQDDDDDKKVENHSNNIKNNSEFHPASNHVSSMTSGGDVQNINSTYIAPPGISVGEHMGEHC